MAKSFILPDGTYFETVTDVVAESFTDNRVAVPVRPSEFHVWTDVGGVDQWVEDDAARLVAERAGLNPFRRAFNDAMKQVSAPDTVSQHMFDQVVQTVEAVRAGDPFSLIVGWFDDVQQIIRSHPDMTGFRDLFFSADAAGDLKVDALCRLAVAIDAGAGAPEIAGLISDFEAL